MAKPQAHSLALKNRAALLAQFKTLRASITGTGAATKLGTFERFLKSGRAAINMTIPGCARFLASGKWLNMYEVVQMNTGATSGPKVRRMLRERLKEWYGPRVMLDRLLRFRRDTHYAALNLGGGGPDYGKCCVRLRPSRAMFQHATIFAGDPLRVGFNDAGRKVLSDGEFFERFAVHADVAALTGVHNPQLLTDQIIIDKQTLVALLEDKETLVEIHVHGAVKRDDIEVIAMRKTDLISLEQRSRAYEKNPPRKTSRRKEAKQYNEVRSFNYLRKLTDTYGLQLIGE